MLAVATKQVSPTGCGLGLTTAVLLLVSEVEKLNAMDALFPYDFKLICEQVPQQRVRIPAPVCIDRDDRIRSGFIGENAGGALCGRVAEVRANIRGAIHTTAGLRRCGK